VALLVGTAPALADGDPASDVLPTGNVFLPTPPPGSAAAQKLQEAVQDAYRHGYRLKVAVIASPSDLGAIPGLMNHPQAYAKFLGLELRFYYAGPLLIVMPIGYGVYDSGRTTATEQKILARLKPPGAGVDELTSKAAAVVERLVATGALKSKDILAPYVSALPATGSLGQPVRLSYVVFDDSGRTRESVVVRSDAQVLYTSTMPLRFTRGSTTYSTVWTAPSTPPAGKLTFCVSARDPTGNHRRSCAPIELK
jgi:hypothetical protein